MSQGHGSITLSVVIVNYNVRYFLEQCLYSVRQACAGLDAEIFVVDNASSDDSLGMLRQQSDIKLIANLENVGFAKANNQAIREARGEYILLLNPDTLVAEDAFAKCLAYAEANPRVGCLGARMIDGTGRYLPESKRGLPTPWVSFTKMSGLARLAPTSPTLNGYYLGHLAEHDTSVVEVLPGAFMWLRAEALQAVGGGLDEDYFMYGEDVDLSYCITQSGFHNVYFPDVTFVHYKGESTRKRTLKYVRTFYNAMAIFARKHVTQERSRVRELALAGVIYLRAFLALVVNVLVTLAFALVDALALTATLLAAKVAWGQLYFGDPNYYDYSQAFGSVAVPLYVGLWVAGLALFGAYEKPYRLPTSFKGAVAGTGLVLVVYALLPLELRTSRAIILLSGSVACLLLPALRLVYSLLRPQDVALSARREGHERRLAVVGSEAETSRVLGLLGKAGVARHYMGRISPPGEPSSSTAIGSLALFEQLKQSFKLEELIFCGRDVALSEVIDHMDRFADQLEFRFVSPEANAIVGSPSRNAPGELYTIGTRYTLAQARFRRKKRLTDVSVAFFILLGFPLCFFTKSPGQTLRNALRVLLGTVTWVGYRPGGKEPGGLPRLRSCVLPQGLHQEHLEPQAVHQLNESYARNYTPNEDWRMLRLHWRDLGRAPTAIERLSPTRWPSHNLTTTRYEERLKRA